MESIVLFRLIFFPVLTLGLLALGMVLGGRMLLSQGKRETLKSVHWTLQNRAYWNVHLYSSFLRLFCNLVTGAVVVFLGTAMEVDLHFLFIVGLIIVGMLIIGPPFTSFTHRVRSDWERIDLKPYRGRMFLSLLFLLPTVALIISMVCIPREVSPTSVFCIFAILAVMLGWQAWGGVWLSIRLGLLRPAPDEWTSLVAETAGKMGVAPPPRVFVANTAMLNAFAYQTGHAVLFTRPLFGALSKDQIRALTKHELGHLQEGTKSQLLRIAQPITYAPLLWLNPLSSQFGFPLAFFLCLGGFILASRLYARFLQKAEFEADAAGHDEESDSAHLAGALTILYRENLVPAILPKGGIKSHPDLYDRLITLEAPPDFDRPPTPNPLWMALLAFACVLACGIVLVAAECVIRWLWA